MSIDDKDTAEITTVRQRMDALDQQIQTLLVTRAETALRLANIRQSTDPQADTDSYSPALDAQILNEVAQRDTGPLRSSTVQNIFREILSACQSLEEPLMVAFLGPEGTYSQAATFKHFGHSVNTLPEAGIADIFHAVENGRARFGIVPVENSTEGTINHTLDLLMSTCLRICGEVSLRIQHQLLSCSTSLDEITAVHAHPQSLAQCRHWLDTHLPNADRNSESSNAAAAQLAIDTPGVAAIAGESAATRYRLNTLMAGIEDQKTNTTRFLIVGDQDIPPSGNDSTSLMISAPHQPGGLRRMLLPLEEAGVSMTRIESRPETRQGRTHQWEYIFFIDVAGHQHDTTLAPVLEKLRAEVPLMRVLGSYPSAL